MKVTLFSSTGGASLLASEFSHGDVEQELFGDAGHGPFVAGNDRWDGAAAWV